MKHREVKAELRKVSNDSDETQIAYAEMGLLPAAPQSMVLHVHGGPHYRNKFGFSSTIAWLTNRGYAVLQVVVLLLAASIKYCGNAFHIKVSTFLRVSLNFQMVSSIRRQFSMVRR